MQIRANANENQVISVSSAARARAEERAGKKPGQQNKQSIFAGDIGLQSDMVTKRKQQAQQKALKIIGDAWGGDRKVDQNVLDMKDKISQLRTEQKENLGIIAEGDAQKEALRQQYGVQEDSQQQKDLELLEKQSDARRHPDMVKLSEEEEKRLEELKDQPLTEYQERCLSIDNYQKTYEVRNDQIEEQIKGYNGAIRGIRLERLKYHGMVDAQKKAEKVMEAANGEILGMLIGEAKDHIDEELEEKVEEAKEKAEEKAEEEEKIDERQEKQEELEERVDEAHEKSEEQERLRKESEERSREETDLLDGMMEAGLGNMGSVPEIKAEIKDMLQKMKLLEEDLKGTTVDDLL